jgi:DNA-binding phage protein
MSTPRTLTLAAVYLRLNSAVDGAGGEAAFARKHGLTRQEVHEAMKGNRHPSPSMLAAVGVRKVVAYVDAAEARHG